MGLQCSTKTSFGSQFTKDRSSYYEVSIYSKENKWAYFKGSSEDAVTKQAISMCNSNVSSSFWTWSFCLHNLLNQDEGFTFCKLPSKLFEALVKGGDWSMDLFSAHFDALKAGSSSFLSLLHFYPKSSGTLHESSSFSFSFQVFPQIVVFLEKGSVEQYFLLRWAGSWWSLR